MATNRRGARRGCSALSAALACALVLFGASAAQAQLDILPKVRIKAGAFFPTGTSLRNIAGDTWLKVGADVSVPFGLGLIGGSTRVGIEYAVNGSSNMVPITLTEVLQPSVHFIRSPVFVGAGIGLWTVHVAGAGSGSRGGFRLLGGVDIGKNTFLELEYDFVGKVHDVRADGLSVNVGMKF